MLTGIFPEDSEDVNSRTVFMQDGAPAHTSRMAMDWLEDRFPGRLISNKSDFMQWPPRSPDLNPVGFLLVGLHEGRNSSSPAWQHCRGETTHPGVSVVDL